MTREEFIAEALQRLAERELPYGIPEEERERYTAMFKRALIRKTANW